MKSQQFSRILSAEIAADLTAKGLTIVPIEPTYEMKMAALAELSDVTVREPKAAAWDALRAYRAMVRAFTNQETPNV